MPASKVKGIPQWQLPENAQDEQSYEVPEPEPKKESTEGHETLEQDNQASSRSSLLDSASEFLKHESIRDAPLARKTSFLESKGLTKPEIDQLLHPQPTEPFHSAADPNPSPPGPSTQEVPSSSSTTTTLPSTSKTSAPSDPAPQAPPIITYPEVLSQAHRPPPLITASRLQNAAYATALTSGLLWGANRFLLTPMFDALTAARHSLFEGTLANLEELNARLEGAVSVVPPMVDTGSKRRGGAGEEEDEDADAESEASDPAEMFSRDVGVQTSPAMSTEEGEGEGKKVGSVAVVEEHVERLDALKRHVVELSETGAETVSAEEETRSSLGNLQAYLEELAYGGRKSALSWEGGFGPLGEPMGAPRASASNMDEIAKFKAEIRSVKGALLSARNFPSGGLGRGRSGMVVGS